MRRSGPLSRRSLPIRASRGVRAAGGASRPLAPRVPCRRRSGRGPRPAPGPPPTPPTAPARWVSGGPDTPVKGEGLAAWPGAADAWALLPNHVHLLVRTGPRPPALLGSVSPARINHERHVNNPGLPGRWIVPPVRKIPDRDGGTTQGGERRQPSVEIHQ